MQHKKIWIITSAIIFSALVVIKTTHLVLIRNAMTFADRPEKILQKIGKRIEQNKYYEFERIGGHTNGFVNGMGRVSLPDKIYEEKLGGSGFIEWTTKAERDKLKQVFADNFDDENIWKHLGGFGEFEAYEEIRRLPSFSLYTAQHFETMQIGKDWYMKTKESPWVNIDHKNVDNNFIEIMFSSLFPLHISDFLRFPIIPSIQREFDGDDIEIKYVADADELRQAGVFSGYEGITQHPYLLPPEYEKARFDIVAVFSSKQFFGGKLSLKKLKKVEIRVRRDPEFRSRIENGRTIPGTFVNEAYSISFMSFGKAQDIYKPF
ncbi:MAG: hypothetical protein Q8R12_04670 [bacterium]|nr:hypothetical protein [bacterium]